MAANDAQDKNLPATQRKLDKAREDGQVARSRDLGHFTAIAAGAGIVIATASSAMHSITRLLGQALHFDHSAVVGSDVMFDSLGRLVWQLLIIVIPMGAAMAGVAVASCLLVGGWNWTLKPIAPKFDKLNPLAGLGKIFSKQQATEALKASALALVLGVVGTLYIRSHLGSFHGLMALPLPAALQSIGDTLVGGLMFVLIVLGLLAAVDAPLQMKMHADKMKMSHQEVKQEHKENEGNQEIKGKIRVRMREASRRRMMAAVPQADLVVMNPTHYAVALKYEDGSMGAPKVVAKGADLIAMAIRDLAKTSKVPVLQAPVLARALYAHAELDREIPAALFSAVAQVLAYVYQMRAAMNGKARMPGELPELNVPAELDPHHVKNIKVDSE